MTEIQGSSEAVQLKSFVLDEKAIKKLVSEVQEKGENSFVLQESKTYRYVLTPRAAEVLASFNGQRLVLRSVHFLDAACAEKLSKFKGETLSFPNLETITPDVAKKLAQFGGNRLFLEGVRYMSKEAAENLGAYNGATLSLGGFLERNPESFVVMFKRRHMVPDRQREESVRIITGPQDRREMMDQPGLAENGEKLELNQATTITPEIESVLKEFHGQAVYLNNITEITPEQAEALSNVDAKELYLDGVKKLDDKSAEALSKFKGTLLSLNGVVDMTLSQAEKIKNFKGKYLSLNGLSETISKEVLEALVQFEGIELHLDGIRVLTPELAEILSKAKCLYLFLGGIKELAAEYAAKLAASQVKGLVLHGLKVLLPKVAVHLAAFSGGYLYLDGLVDVALETLVMLKEYKGTLMLGIEILDEAKAKAISEMEAQVIILNNIRTLDASSAKALVENFKGTQIQLPALQYVDEETLNVLLNSGKVKINENVRKISAKKEKDERQSGAEEDVSKGKKSRSNLSQNSAEDMTYHVEGEDRIDVYHYKDFVGEKDEAMSSYRGEMLSLDVTDLSVDVARKLAQFEGKILSLSKVSNLSLEAANELSKFKGKELIIGGAKIENPLVVAQLVKFKGAFLDLSGSYVSPEGMSELASFGGEGLGVSYMVDDLMKFKGKFVYVANDGTFTSDVLYSEKSEMKDGKLENKERKFNFTVYIDSFRSIMKDWPARPLHRIGGDGMVEDSPYGFVPDGSESKRFVDGKLVSVYQDRVRYAASARGIEIGNGYLPISMARWYRDALRGMDNPDLRLPNLDGKMNYEAMNLVLMGIGLKKKGRVSLTYSRGINPKVIDALFSNLGSNVDLRIDFSNKENQSADFIRKIMGFKGKLNMTFDEITPNTASILALANRTISIHVDKMKADALKSLESYKPKNRRGKGRDSLIFYIKDENDRKVAKQALQKNNNLFVSDFHL